ncbi:MAG: subtype B tannase [Bacteroidota bacterium]
MKRIRITLVCLATCISFVNAQVKSIDLNFNVAKFESLTLAFEGKTFSVRAFENIVYVKNPVDTACQKMNIYIPEEYFAGTSINGYTAATAPIFFPNKVGGYMPSQPASTKNNPMGGRPPFKNEMMPPTGDKKPDGIPPVNGGKPAMGFGGPKQNIVLAALSKGYIVASAGTRGRTSKNAGGIYTGKAPEGIVDLKAAVRYLKYNDKNMPGDANKIISNGTSAGGAMSALLGATGNNADFEPYLKTLGAASATDDIFAVSAYCPITNLENADMAYEWQFFGINTYRKGGPMQGSTQGSSELSAEQIAVSEQLKKLFPAYINSLNLKGKNGITLSLDNNGNGTFKDLVKAYVAGSAQKALNEGIDLSSFAFLTVNNGRVTQIDFDAYVRYMQRQKTPPAFDALDLSSPETNLFGTATINSRHFTEFGAAHSKTEATSADALMVKMMNPMNYIGQPNTKTSKYWRIRHGTEDKDTGLAIPLLLATLLENKGYNVNLELPWEKPHSGDYDLDELFTWIDGICR